MEKTRLIAMGLNTCKWYLYVFHVFFALYVIIVLFASLFDGTSMKDYCIPVQSGESYDLVWGQSTLCRVDWQALTQDILIGSLIVYIFLSGPVWILKFLLEWKKRGFQADEKY